jgi:16S rRNA (guanine966-N2)-methyltransferase
VRPTSDRVREAIFDRLGDLAGAAVLDLYAGTGALGIEAASRGAESVVFVERIPRCVAALRRNLAALGLRRGVRVVSGDVPGVVRSLGRRRERFDLVLLDPPYASDEALRALEALIAADVLAAGATLVLERGRRHPVPVPEGLAQIDERRYGDTVVTRLGRVAERTGASPATEAH